MSKPKIGITLDSVNPEVQNHGAAFSLELWYALRYRYADAVTKSGGIPFALTHQMELINEFTESLDGLLITGGGFDVDPALYGDITIHPSVFLKPERTQFEYNLCKAFMDAKKPILGICGGMQLINVVCGGTLHQHVPDLAQSIPNLNDHSPATGAKTFAHNILLMKNTSLSSLVTTSQVQVNSVHHQAVKDLGQELIITAISDDGIIEAIQHTNYPFLHGIQWHPEFLMHELDYNIFSSFIDAASICHDNR